MNWLSHGRHNLNWQQLRPEKKWMWGFIVKNELVRSISGASDKNLTWSSSNQRGMLLMRCNCKSGRGLQCPYVLPAALFLLFSEYCYIFLLGTAFFFFFSMAANISLVPILNCQPPRQALPINCFLPSPNIPGKRFTGLFESCAYTLRAWSH